MDDFLNQFRKEPNPEFAKRLYERINQPMERKANTQLSRRIAGAWKPALVGAAVVLAAVLAFSPSARVMAQNFLDMFRVKNFAAVRVDPARMAQIQQDLNQNNLDLKSLLSSQVDVLKKPGKPVIVSTPAEAGQQAGITVRTPASLPAGYSLQRIQVEGAGSVRIKVDTAKLQTLMTDLGITDEKVPPQLNGQTVTVNTPPVVSMEYAANNGLNHLTLVEAHNPQVSLPQGVNLAQLGEIALRITGMPADEAHSFAQSIDWTSTMLVPVPANASSFRQVPVRGVTGLLITTDSRVETVPEKTSATGSVSRTIPSGSYLIWAEGDMVYAISGTGNTALVDLANSLQ